jgi:hypothetical protein
MGEKCDFCKKSVAHPCWCSGDAARCRHIVAEAKSEANRSEAEALLRRAVTKPEPLDVQIGGDHYKRMTIQPLTYIEANNIPFTEGNVIKYVSRWRFKNGIEDLKKARDMLTKKIAFEEEKARNADQNKAG